MSPSEVPNRALAVAPSHACKPIIVVLEKLEQRQLMAVTAAIKSSGVMYVKGDENRNVINVVVGADQTKVTIDEQRFTFDSADFGGIRVFADRIGKSMSSINGGDDAIVITGNGEHPATVFGGGGNDLIHGGGGHDRLYGDRVNATEKAAVPGNDTVFGGGGDDTIVGGRGVDKVAGNGGKDSVRHPARKPKGSNPQHAGRLRNGAVSSSTSVQAQSAVPQSPARYTDPNDIVLNLPLDGSLLDTDLYPNVSAPQAVQYIEDAVRGSVLSLDGSTRVNVATAPWLQPGMQNWTMEAWIKPVPGQPTHSYIIGAAQGAGRNFALRISYNDLLVAMFETQIGSTQKSALAVSTSQSATLFDGNWHHVAGVLDRSVDGGQARVYIDGVEVTNYNVGNNRLLADPITDDDGKFHVTVGGYAPWSGSTGGYKGLISDVKIARTLPASFVYPHAGRFNPNSVPPMRVDPHTSVHLDFTGSTEANRLQDRSPKDNDVQAFRPDPDDPGDPGDSFSIVDWQTGVADNSNGYGVRFSKGGYLATVVGSSAFQPGDSSLTLETWIKPDPQSAQKAHAVLIQLSGTGGNAQLRLSDFGKALYAEFASGAASGFAWSQPIDGSSGSVGNVYDGSWHHVAAVLDKSRNGEIRLYLDGQFVGYNTNGQQPANKHKAFPWSLKTDDGIMTLAVGTNRFSPIPFGYEGLLDNVRVSTVARPEFTVPAGLIAPPAWSRPLSEFATLSPLASDASDTNLILTPTETTILLPGADYTAADSEAAQLLRKHLLRAYGINAPATNQFQIKTDGPGISYSGAIIAIGRSQWVHDNEYEGMGGDSFRIRRKKNIITIFGEDASATLQGVVHFLDKYAGVRFYMPSPDPTKYLQADGIADLYTSVPSAPISITFPVGQSVDVYREPYTRGLESTGYSSLNGVDNSESLWLKYNGGTRRKGDHQHSFYDRLPTIDFWDQGVVIDPVTGKSWSDHAFREIYPEIPQGNLIKPDPAVTKQNWQPDFAEVDGVIPSSHPRYGQNLLLEAAMISIEKFFAKNINVDHLAFAVQDGFWYSKDSYTVAYQNSVANEYEQRLLAQNPSATPQERSQSRATGSEQAISRLYWNFMKRVGERLATRYPTENIAGLVYSSPRLTPDIPGFKLPANVQVWHTAEISDIELDGFLEPGAMLDQWANVADSFGWHDWGFGWSYLIPRIYTKHMQDTFQAMHAKGRPIRYYHLEAYPNWGLDGPKNWLMHQIAQDPFVDADQLLRQFCDDMFGPASTPMFEYFKKLEEFWDVLQQNREAKFDQRYETQFVIEYPAGHPLAGQVNAAVQTAVATALNQARQYLNQADQLLPMSTEMPARARRARFGLFNRAFTLTEKLYDLGINATASDFANKATQVYAYARDQISSDPMATFRSATLADIRSQMKLSPTAYALAQVEDAILDIREDRGMPNLPADWKNAAPAMSANPPLTSMAAAASTTLLQRDVTVEPVSKSDDGRPRNVSMRARAAGVFGHARISLETGDAHLAQASAARRIGEVPIISIFSKDRFETADERLDESYIAETLDTAVAYMWGRPR